MTRGTKEEKFIIAAYRQAKTNGDEQGELNKLHVGLQCGLSEKATEVICNMLAQANFIKKCGKENFRLTSNGLALAQSLLQR